MEKARFGKEFKAICQQLKPGSGKLWTNQLTLSQGPKLSGMADQANWYDKQIVNRRIESLNRPINTGNSAHFLNRQRHNLYQKSKEIENRLNHDAGLQYFAQSVGRMCDDETEERTILKDLEDLNLY